MHTIKRFGCSLLFTLSFLFGPEGFSQIIFMDTLSGNVGNYYGFSWGWDGWGGQETIQQVNNDISIGYVMTGGTDQNTFGNSDACLIMFDEYGTVQWAKAYGDTAYDWATCVQATRDAGYIMAGITQSFGAGGNDAYVVKTDVHGNILWSKTYGGAYTDEAYDIKQTKDGGYIIAGYTESFGVTHSGDAYLIKTDAAGNVLWSATYGGISNDFINTVRQTADGGYILAGETYSYRMYNNYTIEDAWIIKTDSLGNKQWVQSYNDGSANKGWRTQSILPSYDGGYVISGSYSIYHSAYDTTYAFIAKTDSSGNIQWAKSIVDTNYNYYYGNWNWLNTHIKQTTDSAYIISVYNRIIKINARGSIQWAQTNGAPPGYYYDNWGSSFQVTNDNGCIMNRYQYNGNGYYTSYIIKTNSLGSSGCNATDTIVMDSLTLHNTSPAVASSFHGDYYNANSKTQAIYVYSSPVCYNFGIGKINPNDNDFNIYPNPANSIIQIAGINNQNTEIKIYDVLGHEIFNIKNAPVQNGSTQLEVSALPGGIYFLRIGNNTQKFIKE